MKINLNDNYGTYLISILKLDGTKAIEGEDYIDWQGAYYIDGKWIYPEGVDINNGIVIFNKKSIYPIYNNRKYIVVVKDNCLVNQFCIMERFKKIENNTSLSNDVFEAVIKEMKKINKLKKGGIRL